MKLIAFIVFEALMIIGLTRANCSQPTVLKGHKGEIKPINYPHNYQKGKRCVWELPADQYNDDNVLFIHVTSIRLGNDNRCDAQLNIGDDNFCKTPTTDCRLYGKRPSKFDLKEINKYVYNVSRCTGWLIEYRLPRTVVLKQIEQGRENQGFQLEYEYISLAPGESNFSGATSTDCSTAGEKLSPQDTIYTTVIVLLIVLLLIVTAALIHQMRKQRKDQKQLLRSSQMLSVSNLAYVNHREHAREDVSSVQKGNGYATIEELADANKDTIDTTHSSNQNLSVMNKTLSHTTLEINDVYAVVRKDKNTL